MKFNFQAKSKNKFQSSSKDEMENSSKDDLKLIKRCLQHLIQWWCPKLIKGSDLDVRWLGWVRKLTRLRLVEWQDSGLLNDNGTLADQFSQLVQLSVLTACPIISSHSLSNYQFSQLVRLSVLRPCQKITIIWQGNRQDLSWSRFCVYSARHGRWDALPSQDSSIFSPSCPSSSSRRPKGRWLLTKWQETFGFNCFSCLCKKISYHWRIKGARGL